MMRKNNKKFDILRVKKIFKKCDFYTVDAKRAYIRARINENLWYDDVEGKHVDQKGNLLLHNHLL